MNNQDAVKLLPEEDYWVSSEPLSIIRANECDANPYHLATKRFKRVFKELDAAKARQQELEAQNKALWELVGECEQALKGMRRLYNSDAGSRTLPEYVVATQAIAAIQKAKEAK